MLSRLASRVTRSWIHPTSNYQYTLPTTGIHPPTARFISSDPTADENSFPLATFVERRLKSVSTAFCFPRPLKAPSSDELDQWKDALTVNVNAAVEAYGDRLSTAPTWVILYLLHSKVYSPSHAITAVNLMLQCFSRADRTLQPALIMLCVRFLAKQNVELPMPNLIKLFLALDLPKPATQFNLLLRNMSHFKPSPTLAKATTEVLEAMHGRQIFLQSTTYRSLLSNSLVTLELAKKLQQTMQYEGFNPNRYHIEAYLRVFAHHGAVHASARYLNLLRERAESKRGVAPHGVELSSRGAHAIVSEHTSNTRWNTEFLSSFKRHTGSAFEYLRDLVDEKTTTAPVPPRVRHEKSRIGNPMRKHGPLRWKRTLHVSDWVTVLNVAAHDRNITSDQLLRLFDDTRASTGYPPTVAIFTVLIRGLARKKDHATALAVWERCCTSWSRRRRIDTKALTVAMGVIVRAGYPQTAFDTLIETTGILIDKEKKPVKVPNDRIGYRRRRSLFSTYAKVDTPLVNSLMNAYQKNGRPDLVFKLWDVFVPLFGVNPNEKTLTIILNAAYSVARWDHTFRGLLEQLGLPNLFNTSPASDETARTKGSMVKHIRFIINNTSSPESDKNDKKEMAIHEEAVQEVNTFLRKTMWGGELAAPKAHKLFRAILLGNYPELEDVVPPAKAVWPDEAKGTSPMRDALSSLGSRLRKTELKRDSAPHLDSNHKAQIHDPSLSVDSPPSKRTFVSTSAYPQITPDEKAFEAYISLLGAMRRSSEIPTVLAWMQALDVRPPRRVLALALALWSEVSVRGPLFEQFSGDSEFDKLYWWLTRWLGRDGVPSERVLAWGFRKLKTEREQ